MTKEELKNKLLARKKLVENQKKIEERKKAILEAKRKADLRKVLEARKAKVNTARTSIARESAIRKPSILGENTKRPIIRENTKRPIIREAILKKPLNNNKVETLTEHVNKRLADPRIPAERKAEFKILSENLIRANRVIAEATQADANTFGVTGNGVSGIVKTYFDIFYGAYLNIITPEIASVQPIKTKNAVISYYETLAGSDKGNVSKGDLIHSPFEVNYDKDYTSNKVVLGKATGTTVSLEKSKWGPVAPKSVVIEGAELTWDSDTTFTGTLNGNAITAGSITESGDNVKVEFTLATAPVEPVEVAYFYDNVYAPTESPELIGNIKTISIEAQTRTVKTKFSFEAGYGLEAEFGGNLGEILAQQAAQQLQREIDLQVMSTAMNAAPTKVKWNKNAGVAVGNYQQHKLSFVDAVAQASNHIFNISKRVRGNILVVGINAFTIVETLPVFKGKFEAGDAINGPAVVGTLNNSLTVIVFPELAENDWLVLYKSKKDTLDAGIVFAPYIPVFSTEPVMLDDFVVRRAFLTSYGVKVVNPNYFVRGEIIDIPTAFPIYMISKDGTETALGSLDGKDAVLNIFE